MTENPANLDGPESGGQPVLTVRLDNQLHADITRIATSLGISKSSLLRRALIEFVTRHDDSSERAS